MSTILSTIGDIIKAIFVGDPTATTPVPSWIHQVVTTITGEPIILMVVLMPFIGVGISLLRRLFRSKA